MSNCPAAGEVNRHLDLTPTVLHVYEGELAELGSWVYVWLRPGTERRIVFVGATGLPPAARMWLHLHHEDPEIGRIASKYPAGGGDLGEALDILAFPLPEGTSRRAVRDALIAKLAANGDLSPLYCGFPPAEFDGLGNEETVAEAITLELRRRL